VDVGKNIGAELQTDQAEADKRVAQARAEERRAMAVALEQENRARVEEARANVVEAEAQVPAGHGRGLPLREPGDHGLPAHPEPPERHQHAARAREVDRAAEHRRFHDIIDEERRPEVQEPARNVLAGLRKPATLREAVLLAEVIGPPRAVRPFGNLPLG
jgi:hypothetical protein